jgi:hypothetical protein
VPWALGPPDGRYLVRGIGSHPPAAEKASPTHVLLFATLGAPQRRFLQRSAKLAEPEPPPAPVTTGRATVISVADPFPDQAAAERWLKQAGEEQLGEDMAVLGRALHVFRLVTADPFVQVVGRTQVLVARLGFGEGEQVSDGRWSAARELGPPGPGHQRRSKVLEPQARLAAALGGRERPLVCEELALRAHLDVEHGRHREASLQVLVALDAAIAELSLDAQAPLLAERLPELRSRRPAVAAAAQAALAGDLSEAQREVVISTLQRIEAALRARAVSNA